VCINHVLGGGVPVGVDLARVLRGIGSRDVTVAPWVALIFAGLAVGVLRGFRLGG